MEIPGFVGGSNVLQSRMADCERTINFYPEPTQSGGAKVEYYLRRTEGTRLRYYVGPDEVTALFYQDGRAFGVAGTNFIEMFDDYTALIRGTVAFDGIDVATIDSNGDQLFIVAGSEGYTYDLATDVLTQITDMDFPSGEAVGGLYFAGYFLVWRRNSRIFQWSALEDGTAWDALDVAERIWASDFISFIIRLGTVFFIVGTKTTEVWWATGSVEIFGPAQGTLIEHGCIARQTRARISTNGADTIAWLDQTERGGGVVVVAKGYQPQDVSTFAINQVTQLEEGLENHAVAFAMNLYGHELYWLQMQDTTVTTTYVLDITTGLWHERAHWDPSTDVVSYVRHAALCHMYAFERHFIGSRFDGSIYELSTEYLSDDVSVP